MIEIYTDGACKGNPGPGGWGALLRYNGQEKELKGAEGLTTNNRMELTAAIEALASLTKICQVDLYTDSNYLRQGMLSWLKQWKKKNWRNSKNEPVKNIDLWKRLDELANLHTINWHWVKGHSGHPENERADALANEAILELGDYLMRQIVLDTETTGLDPKSGHRVIEIGCVELINRKFTGNHYHVYLNPEREVDEGAFRVHGISNLFLKDKPVFKNILKDFVSFIDNAELIIHNAPFDVGFLNSEFQHVSHNKKLEEHCSIFDSLVYARKKHAGQRNTLDALCKRYHVNNSNRELHGALLDAEILAFVYLAMTGGQTELFADQNNRSVENVINEESLIEKLTSHSKVFLANDAELLKHREFLEFMEEN